MRSLAVIFILKLIATQLRMTEISRSVFGFKKISLSQLNENIVGGRGEEIRNLP